MLQAYKLPNTTVEEAERRKQAIEEASKTAVISSLKVVSACEKILHLAYITVTEGSKLLVTDGAAAAIMARACQRVAAYNVHINLAGVKDKAVVVEAERLLKSHLAEGEKLEANVLQEVEQRL